MNSSDYELVQLPNGTHAVYVAAYDERMHPGLGPAAEAKLLYVEQLRLLERMRGHQGEFVVWDVGLGAAANAIAVIEAGMETGAFLHLVSFDDTIGPLEFALRNAAKLSYLGAHHPTLAALLQNGSVERQSGDSRIRWRMRIEDFPTLMNSPAPGMRPSPHAILYDAFSPSNNPAMWTLPLFEGLFAKLDCDRPCALATYSRSTMVRVSLLLAGFYVGKGGSTGLKEETTVAANRLELLDEPLGQQWLEQAQRSGSAEPLQRAVYRQSALSATSWRRLCAHPQFSGS